VASAPNPNRPGIGETIFAAGSLVHGHPALLASWLILGLAGGIILHLISSPEPVLSWGLLAFIPYGLAAIFISAGYMGSLHLILKLGGWSPVAVIECGRHYFLRFFLLGLIQGSITIVIPVLIGFLALLAAGQFHRIFFILPLLPLLPGLVVLNFFLTFARAGVVVKEKGVFKAIAYSFRVVWSNFLPTLVFLLVFFGVPFLFSFLVGKLYGAGLELLRKFFTTLLTAYGHLLLMAALVYFAAEIDRSPEEEI